MANGSPIPGGPEATRRRSQRVILSLRCDGAHRRRSESRLLRRRNAYPRCERARGAYRPGRQSGKRSKASADEPRHQGGASVPGGEFGSDVGRQSSGRRRISKAFPGFLAASLSRRKIGSCPNLRPSVQTTIEIFVAQPLLAVWFSLLRNIHTTIDHRKTHTARVAVLLTANA